MGVLNQPVGQQDIVVARVVKIEPPFNGHGYQRRLQLGNLQPGGLVSIRGPLLDGSAQPDVKFFRAAGQLRWSNDYSVESIGFEFQYLSHLLSRLTWGRPADAATPVCYRTRA